MPGPLPERVKQKFTWLPSGRMAIFAEIANVEDAARLIDLIVANANASFEGEVEVDTTRGDKDVKA